MNGLKSEVCGGEAQVQGDLRIMMKAYWAVEWGIKYDRVKVRYEVYEEVRYEARQGGDPGTLLYRYSPVQRPCFFDALEC